jgi:S1-C subfamily serine protease
MRYLKFLFLFVIVTALSCSPQNSVKRILPRESFLKIQKYLDITMCHPEKKDHCMTKRFGASASGVVVDSNGENAYALTAAHVCVDDHAKKILGNNKWTMEFSVINIHKRYFPIEIIAIDSENDLCVLYVKGLYSPAVRIAADAPEPGDRIYNAAAPLGIFDKNMVPIFDGFFDGNSGNRAIYSLPAKGGSSGSPIVNHRGELVGMVSAVYVYFPEITISPRFHVTKSFINREVGADKKKRNMNAVINFFGQFFNKQDK